jgi:hypothetical protein
LPCSFSWQKRLIFLMFIQAQKQVNAHPTSAQCVEAFGDRPPQLTKTAKIKNYAAKLEC